MKKGTFSTLMLILVLLIGLSLLLYPTVSDFWNSQVQTKAVAGYLEEVAVMDEEKYTEVWEAARSYNDSLLERDNSYTISDGLKLQYDQLLNISGNGIMGYIEIPVIDVRLPIYHGIDESVLQVGIGHLDWTSLPVGGESTHCVVSGHRGLPSARLFTDLDKMVVGDLFLIHVLDETLTYEVDQILVVEPQETQELLIQEGKDLCTLVTCTPYGINSHRLLIRGHRVENLEEAVTVRVTADAIRVEPMIVSAVIFVPMLLVLLLITFAAGAVSKCKNKKR